MKKLVTELLRKYLFDIKDNWTIKLIPILSEKLTETQIRTFVDSCLSTFIEVLESGDYKNADQFLVDAYVLFSSVNINLLEISQLFSQGRFAILNFIENNTMSNTDPVVILGYIDDLIEQIFARYGMLHQETKMSELKHDRDRLASKLELNQQYLRNILIQSDQAIMMIDINEKFIAWNKGAEKIFGYTEEEILGKPSTFLLPDEKKYFEELNQILENSRNSSPSKIIETERRKKNGEIISVKITVAKIPSKNGEYAGRSIIIKDHSEFKKLQAQIDQSEKLAVIGQIAAGVAHEIGKSPCINIFSCTNTAA